MLNAPFLLNKNRITMAGPLILTYAVFRSRRLRDFVVEWPFDYGRN